MTGTWILYQEMQRVRGKCSECGEEMVRGLLESQQHMKHKNVLIWSRHWATTPPGRDPRTYNMAFPTAGDPRNCPVKGCRGRETKRTATRALLIHRHFRDTAIILEEGNLHHTRCPWCDILVPWKDLNGGHMTNT